jgi:hypothetical protein
MKKKIIDRDHDDEERTRCKEIVALHYYQAITMVRSLSLPFLCFN